MFPVPVPATADRHGTMDGVADCGRRAAWLWDQAGRQLYELHLALRRKDRRRDRQGVGLVDAATGAASHVKPTRKDEGTGRITLYLCRNELIGTDGTIAEWAIPVPRQAQIGSLSLAALTLIKRRTIRRGTRSHAASTAEVSAGRGAGTPGACSRT